ncbi:uncharacterized protein LOC123558858 [Mercenaria mercenaria]|uniref:uncharacterized protein LOC123558858 n=1 Tax=Mercenaria mercenaria TaxID=6596 RepID=UPI001E1D8CB8|nr:uncharacterized protein LOC123558858 [Mercenaria mercenaria]
MAGYDWSFYNYYDYYADDSEPDNKLYIILLATLGSVLVIVIAVVVSVKVYKHMKAKKTINPRPRTRSHRRRLSVAQVYPNDTHGNNDNRYHDNHLDYNLPPAYSEIHARPMSPPPRYSMFEINTPR